MIMQLLFVTSTMVFEYSTIRLIVCIHRYSAAGPDLADSRPYVRLIPLLGPSPAVTRKKWNSVNQFAQSRR